LDIEIPEPVLKWSIIVWIKKKRDLKKVTCSAFGKPGGGFLFLKISYIVPDRQVIFVQFSF
jgi:hypothetical protein